METKQLSIIIPIYNVEKYISKCLESILDQSFTNEVEVICIDDGSTDKSGNICDLYAEKYKFIKVIHTPNKGVSMARNIGLANATGKYIAWIDSDDYISKDWYKNISRYLNKNYDLIYFDMDILFSNGQKRRKYYSWKSADLSPRKLYTDLATGLISSQLWSKVIKRKYWEGINFDVNMVYCEDYRILHKVIINVHTIKYIHKSLYYYVQREDSIVHDKSKLIHNALLGGGLVKERIAFFNQNNIPVPNDGIYLAIDVFLWNYIKGDGDKRIYENYYKIYLHVIKKNIFKWLLSPHINYRKKVQMLLIIIGIARWIKR